MVVRLSLCRRVNPLPVARLTALIRCARALVLVIGVTLGSDWASVALDVGVVGRNFVTTSVVSTLAVVTMLGAVATIALLRVPDLPLARYADDVVSDGLGDAIAAIEEFVRPFRAIHRIGGPLITWTERLLLPAVRAHPVSWATALSVLFAAVLAEGHQVSEGGGFAALAVFVGVGAASMYAFLLGVGAYLGVVHSSHPAAGFRRRLIDATVVSATAVCLALAFRDYLRWAVAGSAMGAHPGTSLELLAGAAAVTFVITLALETMVGAHRTHAFKT
jgi:hypothetical protein